MSEKNSKPEIEAGKAFNLKNLIEYVSGSIVSRTIVKSNTGTITLFAFDAGQGLSEHSAPFDALVQVVDGQALITIGGKEITVSKGEMVLMPADIPHAVMAQQRFIMLLTMIKEKK